MRATVIADPRERQEELGQFLTPSPVADFMGWLFGSRGDAIRSSSRDRWGLLVKAVIKVFCARWSSGAAILGTRDARRNLVHLNAKDLATLSVTLDSAAQLPDVIGHHTAKNWLMLIEAVTSAGPVDGRRRKELKELFAGCKAGLVFATAFKTRRAMQSFVSQIAWESEAWIADDPDHMNKTIRTDVLVDRAAEDLYPTWEKNREQWNRTGGDHPNHYLGSAIWFTRIGHAMAEAMTELLPAQ